MTNLSTLERQRERKREREREREMDDVDLGELNEADLLDDSDLKNIEGFSAPAFAPSQPSAAAPSFGGDFGFESTPFSQPSAAPPSFDSFGGGFDAPSSSSSSSSSAPSQFEAPVSFTPTPVASQVPSNDFFTPAHVESPSHFAQSESGPLAKYQEAYRLRMDQKDQESAARKKAILEDAQREIADYMDERQKRTRKNREKHEKFSQACQSAGYNPELPWGNIPSLVDLNALRTNTKDVSRFREVLSAVTGRQ